MTFRTKPVSSGASTSTGAFDPPARPARGSRPYRQSQQQDDQCDEDHVEKAADGEKLGPVERAGQMIDAPGNGSVKPSQTTSCTRAT